MMKNKEVVKESGKKELQQEEVNVYAGCNTAIRYDCMHDCFITNDCWLSCAQ